MLISYWKNHDYDKHFSDIANMYIVIVFNPKWKGVWHAHLEECAQRRNKGYLLNSTHCTVRLLPDLWINWHPRWDCLCSAAGSGKNRTPLGAFSPKGLLTLSGSPREQTRTIHEYRYSFTAIGIDQRLGTPEVV